MISFPFYFYRKQQMKEGSRLLPTYVQVLLVNFFHHFSFTLAENRTLINWWTWSHNMTLQYISEEPRKAIWRKLTLYISFFNYFLSFLTFFMVYFGNILPGYVSVFYRVCYRLCQYVLVHVQIAQFVNILAQFVFVTCGN